MTQPTFGVEYRDDLPDGVPAVCMTEADHEGEEHLLVHIRPGLDPGLEAQILDGIARVGAGGPLPAQVGAERVAS